MSVRTELEEVVKWISELAAKEEPEPILQPLPREAWQAIDRDLRRASKKFAEAHVALLNQAGGLVLAEFARDLEREAEGLALRAHMLSRRASRTPETEATGRKTVPPAVLAPATGETAKGAPQAVGSATGPEDRPSPPQPPRALVASAADTVETAHEKLEAVERPDHASQAFEEELDVLAEMALSLRQKCERLDELKPAKGKR